DSHGVVRSGGRALRGPLVVDGYASTVQLADARLVARAPRDTLVLPRGPARLRLYVIGRAADGLLVGSRGALLFWTARPGEAVVPERAHARGDRRALDVLATRLRGGERGQILRHREQLVDADPALVAGLVAARAAALAVEGHAVARRGDVRGHAGGDHLLDGRLVHLTAVRAELAREPLREHAGDGGAGKER